MPELYVFVIFDKIVYLCNELIYKNVHLPVCEEVILYLEDLGVVDLDLLALYPALDVTLDL